MQKKIVYKNKFRFGLHILECVDLVLLNGVIWVCARDE